MDYEVELYTTTTDFKLCFQTCGKCNMIYQKIKSHF